MSSRAKTSTLRKTLAADLRNHKASARISGVAPHPNPGPRKIAVESCLEFIPFLCRAKTGGRVYEFQFLRPQVRDQETATRRKN